jgi:hypothetical protein
LYDVLSVRDDPYGRRQISFNGCTVYRRSNMWTGISCAQAGELRPPIRELVSGLVMIKGVSTMKSMTGMKKRERRR